MFLVVLWRGSCGKELREARRKQPARNKTLSPATHQKLNPVKNHINELRSEASQLSLQMSLALDKELHYHERP